MGISVEASDGKNELTICVGGRFDFALHDEFRKSYEGVVEPGAKVVVDMKDVDYMDSSALGMLLLLREYVGEEKADIRLLNGSAEIRNILQVSNFDQLFKIE